MDTVYLHPPAVPDAGRRYIGFSFGRQRPKPLVDWVRRLPEIRWLISRSLYCLPFTEKSFADLVLAAENRVHLDVRRPSYWREKEMWADPAGYAVPEKAGSATEDFFRARVGGIVRYGYQYQAQGDVIYGLYSAGLRASEVMALKLSDIDSGRMQITVNQAKGKKDRVVGLSVLLLDILRAYLLQASPRPQVYLFESITPGEPLRALTAQAIFQ